MELKQSWLFDKRHFKLLEDGILIRSISPTEDVEVKFKYEQLGLETAIIRKKETSIVYLVLLVLASILGRFIFKDSVAEGVEEKIAIVLGFLVLGVLFLLAWADANKPQLIIRGGEQTFSLLKNSPKTEIVNAFVLELQSRIVDRIIQLQVRPNDKNFSYNHKKSVLDYLLEEKVIDKERYNKELFNMKSARRKNKSDDPEFPGFSPN